ncbi:MAG: hypothetical protein ACQES1_11160 [Bacteroidota bacterium]
MTNQKSGILILFVLLGMLINIETVLAQQANNDTLPYSDFVRSDLKETESKFKNTSISIRLPKHFNEFSNGAVSGYMHTGTASSIVAFERNDAPFMLTQDSIRPEQLTGDSAKLVLQEDLKTYNGAHAKLFIVEFTVDGVEVYRLMFFTGNYDKTVFLQANYPKGFDKLLRKVITESFRTVKFDRS